MKGRSPYVALVAVSLVLTACRKEAEVQPLPSNNRLSKYTPVRLTADLGRLSDGDRRMIPLLISAAQTMDTVFQRQAYAARDSLLERTPDPALRRLVEINYGPWDRLDGNAPFIDGVGPKPAGAEFYPHDLTKEEFETAVAGTSDSGAALRSQYTVVRRNGDRGLTAVPYREVYADQVRPAAAKLREAAALATDPGLKRYLELRATALETDDYQPSDFAWLDMKTNAIDVVIGPIETYEDQLFGYKAAHEAFVLLKDGDWSRRLARYAALLPELQQGLPVPAEYKRESPGTDSDLNAYDVLYYAGDANAGAKTIAINLPNDEQVQLRKGTRRLQLKNAMRAKFEKILTPIAAELIDADQQSRITFDAFFANVMFHEVAHGLGIKNTIAGRGTVREALKEQHSALEEAKADVLGLYMITRLRDRGELSGTTLDDHYVTFLAGIFRSIRFGTSSAHGRGNAMQLAFLEQHGAFTRDAASGRYRVDVPKMRVAVDALAERILRFQGDGDYAGVTKFMAEHGERSAAVRPDLDRLATRGIPVDIVFEQGLSILGIEK